MRRQDKIREELHQAKLECGDHSMRKIREKLHQTVQQGRKIRNVAVRVWLEPRGPVNGGAVAIAKP